VEEEKNKGKLTNKGLPGSYIVSWSLTSLFSINMAVSKMKGQKWTAIPTQ